MIEIIIRDKMIKMNAIFISLDIIMGIGPMNIIPPAFFSILVSIGSKSSCIILRGNEKIKITKEMKIRIIPKSKKIPFPYINGNIIKTPAFASPLKKE